MRTSRDANKYASNRSSGRYTGNGFIPSRPAQNSQHTPVILLWVLVATLVLVVVTVAYVVIQAV